MTEIGSFEARTHFSDVLRRVALGEEFVVTVRGKPVAHLTPPSGEMEHGKVEALLQELGDFRIRISERGGVLKAGESYKDLAREGLKS